MHTLLISLDQNSAQQPQYSRDPPGMQQAPPLVLQIVCAFGGSQNNTPCNWQNSCCSCMMLAQRTLLSTGVVLAPSL